MPLKQHNIPSVKQVIKENGWYIAASYHYYHDCSTVNPSQAALMGILVPVIIAFWEPTKPEVDYKVYRIFKGMLLILATAASTGLLLGMVSLTGIGLKISSLLITLSGDNLLFLLMLIAFCGTLFGMGLPVVASYIILSVLAAPAMIEMGVPLLIAHLVVLWYSVTANITPPVAIAAYAGATLAKGNIMKTAVESLIAGAGMYIIPDCNGIW